MPKVKRWTVYASIGDEWLVEPRTIKTRNPHRAVELFIGWLFDEGYLGDGGLIEDLGQVVIEYGEHDGIDH